MTSTPFMPLRSAGRVSGWRSSRLRGRTPYYATLEIKTSAVAGTFNVAALVVPANDAAEVGANRVEGEELTVLAKYERGTSSQLSDHAGSLGNARREDWTTACVLQFA